MKDYMGDSVKIAGLKQKSMDVGVDLSIRQLDQEVHYDPEIREDVLGSCCLFITNSRDGALVRRDRTFGREDD